MKLIIANNEYPLKNFNFRIAANEEDSNIYQKNVMCELLDVTTTNDVETIFGNIVESFDGALSIELSPNSVFEFENYKYFDTSLSADITTNMIITTITFVQPVDVAE